MENIIKGKELDNINNQMKKLIIEGEEEDELKLYFDFIKNIIKKEFERDCKEDITYDILDTEKTSKYKLIVLKEKQRQMKIGNIWQEVLGGYKSFTNLGQGHETGLDLVSHERKIIMELKNRTNTDNASAKKANLDKLAKFKIENPEYTCIYGNINDTTEKKTLEGSEKNIIHNNVKILHLTGMTLLNYILEENTHQVIEFIKEEINKYF